MSFRAGQIDRLVAFGGIHGVGGGHGGGDGSGTGGPGPGEGAGGSAGTSEGTGSVGGSYGAASAADAFGVGAAAAERDAANNANQSSVGVGYDGGYYGGGIAGGDQNQNGQREAHEAAKAQAAADAEDKSESPSNQRTSTRVSRSVDARRDIDTAYTLSQKVGLLEKEAIEASPHKDVDMEAHKTALASIRGTPTSTVGYKSPDGFLQGYSADAQKDAKEAYGANASNGVLGMASYAVNPVVGLAVNSYMDANQAAKYGNPDSGPTTSAMDHAANAVARNATIGLLNNAVAPITSKVGYDVAGVPGALASSSLAKSGVKSAVNDMFNGSSGTSSSTEAGFEGFSGNSEAQSVASTNTSTESTNSSPGVETGWDSSFGSYDSHVAGFKSYGADTAQQAFS